MHMLSHGTWFHLFIVWALAAVACGSALTFILILTLRNPGTRAAPRGPRDKIAGGIDPEGAGCTHAGAAPCRYHRRHIDTPPAAWALTAAGERLALPSTLPPLPRPPQAAWPPRIRPQVVPFHERMTAYYVRADTPVARVLSQAGWRSWD
jgi:hypothetical protein